MSRFVPLLAALALACCSAGEAGYAQDVTAEEAADLARDPSVLILDVRTPQEHAAGAIAGSTNVDWNAPDFAERVAELDRARPVLLHCESGGRSSQALRTLATLGFEDVAHLDGGMRAWREAGLPMQRN